MHLCILIPFYGKWPPYLPFFLEGAKHNDWLDIIFISDLIFPDNTPKNVHKLNLTFDELKSLIEDKLNLRININDPYKLCDFRPAYGIIFSDFIASYDYWGFGDIDLIYGNINKLISLNEIMKYEIISVRKHWISGSFSLIKNTEKTNNLFRKADFESVFTNPEFVGFDECAKSWLELLSVGSSAKLMSRNESFTSIIHEEELKKSLKTFFKDLIKESIDKDAFVYWNQGKLTDNRDQEYLHFHYLIVKRNPAFYIPKWQKIPSKFVITRTGIYTTNDFNSMIYPLLILLRILRSVPSVFTLTWDKVKQKFI